MLINCRRGLTFPWHIIALVVAGLLVLGQTVFAGGVAERGRSRTITVSGSGTASGTPDIAVVRLGVEAHNADVNEAIKAAGATSQAVLSSLEKNGVAAADIQTQQYTIGFVRNPRSAAGSSGAGGGGGYYQVTDVAAVTVQSLAKVGAILDGALAAGANAVQGISFEVSDSSTLEREARAKAFRGAREKALQLAKLAGVTLGPVLTISAAGSGGPQPVGGFRAEAFAAPAVSPGSLQVTSTVHVVFAINQP